MYAATRLVSGWTNEKVEEMSKKNIHSKRKEAKKRKKKVENEEKIKVWLSAAAALSVAIPVSLCRPHSFSLSR